MNLPNQNSEFSDLEARAEKGDAMAQKILELIYAKIMGMPQDFSKALKWYRKAAKQGYAVAQNNLGFMYYEGQGVAQDYTEAVKWWRTQGRRAGTRRGPIRPWGDDIILAKGSLRIMPRR